MDADDRLDLRFRVTDYAPGRSIQMRTVSAEELETLNIQDYDHLLAPVWGIYGFRDSAGEWDERPLDGSGLGEIGLAILKTLQLHPGIFLTPRDIANRTDNWNLLHPNPLAARIRANRAAHGEDGKNPRLVLTRRNGGYALKWPAEFSWIWIERIT